MKILVTGGAGFIGKHTVKALDDRGHEVYVADRVTGLDLAEERAIAAVAENELDLVVHHASVVSTQGSIERPMETFRDTVQTAANVLEGARIHNTPVIVTSSVKARDGRTPYGAAKRMVETWAREYADTFGLPVVINRPGTVYGPGQEGSAESGWIAWFLKAKREGLPVVINGDGRQIRDLLHVDDYVRLLVSQVEHFDVYAGTTWDVGGGPRNAIPVREMADELGLSYTLGPARIGDAFEYIGINDAPHWRPRINWRESDVFAGLV